MKKPIYKRVWFWIVVVLILGGVGMLRNGGHEPEETAAPTAEVRAMPESTPAPTAKPTPAPSPSPTATPRPTATPTETPETIHGVPSDTIVYVSEKSSTIHRIHDCSGMKNYREMTVAEADAKGYDYCPHCW